MNTEVFERSMPGFVTYCCCGNNLLSDDPQSVHHRDVAQSPGNTQCRVTILDKDRQSLAVCPYMGICVNVILRTTVIALGLAPYCNRTLMMCVFPCWAAW